jgi:hypothetical protein
MFIQPENYLEEGHKITNTDHTVKDDDDENSNVLVLAQILLDNGNCADR